MLDLMHDTDITRFRHVQNKNSDEYQEHVICDGMKVMSIVETYFVFSGKSCSQVFVTKCMNVQMI